jgi:N-acetyl sugar amidotransferase
MSHTKKTCTHCIMDETDPDIQFDDNGVCNHCHRYRTLVSSRVFEGEEAKAKLNALVEKMKQDGIGKEYDCLIGVSGGVDSTYVAYKLKKLGLRPLAVHFDNGWNSELAVSNIEKTLSKLGIDLYTYVIDWQEFKDLQLSFLKASTPDGEIPTDHAIDSFLWQQASKRGIKYIISGMNFKSEAMSVPAWAYGHSDWKYIKAIHKKFGNKKLANYPHYTFFDLFYYNFIKGIRIVSLLNYIDYNKQEAMKVLQDELGWVYYGGKHYESIYTRFYQAYILPVKFNIDKRRGHLSDLINSGQITRAEAMEQIQNNPYPKEFFDQDLAFVKKKFNLDQSKFDEIMNLPVKSFRDYPNSYGLVQVMRNTINILRKIGLYHK